MSDNADGIMGRAEAERLLAGKFRVRIAVELEHEGRATGMRGATMADDPGELAAALMTLVNAIMARLYERLALQTAEEPDT